MDDKVKSMASDAQDALESIDDLSKLRSHPLARQLDGDGIAGSEHAGRKLQQWLRNAIERFRTDSERTLAERIMARKYAILRLRYLERREPESIWHLLDIARATYFRNHQDAVREIGEMFSEEVVRPKGPLDTPIFGGYQTPLVGRESELEMLRALYDAAASGRGGSVAMITGDQGLGKSRLARELGKYCETVGGRFLEGRFAAWEGSAPYGALAHCLRLAIRGLDREAISRLVGPYSRELARILPELAEGSSSSEGEPIDGTEGRQLRFYDGVFELVRNLAEDRPLVLFLDDLHMAPQMNLQLHIARRLDELRVLIVYAARERELVEKPALISGRNELVHHGLITFVRLDPLNEHQTGEMVAHAFGARTATRLTQRVHAICRGNPFFAIEILRSLEEQGAVAMTRDGWNVIDDGRILVPETFKLLVQDRVTRLGEDALPVLQQASVVGRDFSFPVLRRMVDLPDARLDEVMEKAVAGGILVDTTESATVEQYGFREDHIRESLYEGIPAPRRRRYHRQAGRSIEISHPQRVEELAYHFTEGSDQKMGARYSFEAAERASAAFTWNRAIPLYENALVMWEDLEGHIEERAEASESLGNACYKSGISAQNAVRHFRQSLGFYRELGKETKEATIHSQLGREYMHSGNLSAQDLNLSVDHFQQAKTLLDHEPESIRHGMAYCGLAMVHLDRLELNEALSWSDRALKLGETLDAPAVRANALIPFGSGAALNNPREAAAAFETGWQLSVDHELGFQADLARASAARNLGVTLKDPGTGFEWVNRRPAYDTTYSLFDIPAHLVAFHAFRGEFGKAEQQLEELQSRLSSLGQPTFGLWPDELALLWFRKGDFSRARSHLSEALSWTVRSGNRLVEAATAQKLGQLSLVLEEYETAETQLQRSLALNRSSGNQVGELAVLPHLSDLYCRTDRLNEANEMLVRAHEIENRIGRTGALEGDILLAIGNILARENRLTEAETAFSTAIEVYRKFGLPWDEARVLFEWGQGTEMNRSGELMQKALAKFESMGAGPWADLCRRQLSGSEQGS